MVQDAKMGMSRVLGSAHHKLKHYGLVAQAMLFLVPIMVGCNMIIVETSE